MVTETIEELYALQSEDICPILNKYEKTVLIDFANKHEIPVKTYHSRKNDC